MFTTVLLYSTTEIYLPGATPRIPPSPSHRSADNERNGTKHAPTRHLGGGACVPRAAFEGLLRASFAGFGGSRVVGSKSREKETILRLCRRRVALTRHLSMAA